MTLPIKEAPMGSGSRIMSRRSRVLKSLKRSQRIDDAAIEQIFEFSNPKDGLKAGDACYISATINNRRYYGILVDQDSIQAASIIHFEDEAESMKMAQKLKFFHEQSTAQNNHQEKENESQNEGDEYEIADSSALSSHNEMLTITMSRKRKASDLVGNEDETHSKYSIAPALKSDEKNLPAEILLLQGRSIQKFRYIDPAKIASLDCNSEREYSSRKRFLAASYGTFDEASGGDLEKAYSIKSACDKGGDFVDGFFYQYEIQRLQLKGNEIERDNHDPTSNRVTIGFQEFIQNVILPSWYPLSNHKATGPRLHPVSYPSLVNSSPVTDSIRVMAPMDPRSRYRICVVGGGIAGLSCCLELLRECEKGKIDAEVILLEARNRLGGRICTDRDTFKSVGSSIPIPVDLGASWIHGITDNPLASVAEKAGVDFVRTSEDVKMLQAGMQLVDAKKDENAGEFFDKLLDVAAATCWELECETATSDRKQSAIRWYASGLTEDGLTEGKGGTKIRKPYRSRPPAHRQTSDDSVDYAIGRVIATTHLSTFARLSEQERRMLLWNLKNVEYALGANVRDLSMKFWDIDERHAFEGDHVLLRQGYSSVIDYLHRSLQSYGDRFVCNLEFTVGKVEYARKTSSLPYRGTSSEKTRFIDMSDTCRVTSHDGSVSHKCDFVVSAVPLGVLKESISNPCHALKFQPELPFLKRDAIASVGFGLLNKVYLQFESAFWRKGIDFDPDQNIFGNASGSNPHQYMFLDMGNILHPPGRDTPPAILMSLISGIDAVACELLSDEQLVAQTMETLRILFSSIDVPEPLSARITRWGSDPFARGSYTYLPPGTTDEDFQSLQSPVNANGDSLLLEGAETMRLFFAGEHTTRLHPSMAHGAMLSGMRAALEITGEMVVKVTAEDPCDRVIPLSMFRYMNPKVALKCSMCHRIGTRIREGTLFAFKRGARLALVHNNCAEFSPEVEVNDGIWRNVLTAVNRSRSLQCTVCRKTGATVGCSCLGCNRCYHVSCGEDTGWRFERDGKEFKCDLHRSYTIEDSNRISMEFFFSKKGNLFKCALCHSCDQSGIYGQLFAYQKQTAIIAVHENCVRYTSDNFADLGDDKMSHIDHEYRNIFTVVDLASKSLCQICKKTGATIGCKSRNCNVFHHFLCAQKSGWDFQKHGTVFWCDKHRVQSKLTEDEPEVLPRVECTPDGGGFRHELLANLEGSRTDARDILDNVAIDDHLFSGVEGSVEELSIDENSFKDGTDSFDPTVMSEIGPLTYITKPNVFIEPRLVRIFRTSIHKPWDIEVNATLLSGTGCYVLSIAAATNKNADPFDPLREDDIIKSMNGSFIGSSELDSLNKVMEFLRREVDVFLEVQRPATLPYDFC